MSTEGFFGQATPRSVVKADVVAKYFWAWAKILYKDAFQRGATLRYLDLYAGTGRYEDGTPSTPLLLVLGKAIADHTFRALVTAHLNEKDPESLRKVRAAVLALPGIELLPHQPEFGNVAVDDAMSVRFEGERPFPPTFSFVDPWGYKGLTVKLIRALTQHWGSDCIFFFNYNRINAGLNNDLVREEMDQLFGESRAAALRSRICGMRPENREQAILREVRDAIEEGGERRTFTFRFKADSANRTSHHLILVTKFDRGIWIMKNILAKASTRLIQGVPSYEFNPNDAHRLGSGHIQLSLFASAEPPPLDLLQENLLARFAELTVTAVEAGRAYDDVEDRYTERNYKDTLLQLEKDGRIGVDPPADQRPSRNGLPTLADWVRVIIPPRSE